MDLNFNKNEDYNKLLVSDLRKRFIKVKLGGGQKRIDKHHEKGKMTARERIDYLLAVSYTHLTLPTTPYV